MDLKRLEETIEAGRAERHRYRELDYVRITDTVAGLERGSACLPDGRVVRGYPSIGRIHTLEQGLEKQLPGPFHAEEKIDGFNVRIFAHQGQVYGLSRGGFVCAFATDRIQELLDLSLFEDDPELVLCAEIAGPDNPYLEGHPPHVTEDVAVFVFDAMRTDRPGFLPHAEKMALVERHGLPTPRMFGRFLPHDREGIAAVIRQLDTEGAEGLVLKAEADDTRAKYVTGRSNIIDIALCSEALLDLPPEYFTNRLMRLALFAEEHGEHGDPELRRQLGDALLQGLHHAIRLSRERGRVGHPFRCRFRERDNARHFLEHLEATGGHRVKIARDAPRPEGDYWLVEFERLLPHMTGTLSNVLAGHKQFD